MDETIKSGLNKIGLGKPKEKKSAPALIGFNRNIDSIIDRLDFDLCHSQQKEAMSNDLKTMAIICEKLIDNKNTEISKTAKDINKHIKRLKKEISGDFYLRESIEKQKAEKENFISLRERMNRICK